MKAATVRENVTIWYRGPSYELGRGQGFYGIWDAAAAGAQSSEWWPETPEGWNGAWSRFTAIEAPGAIVQLVQPPDAAVIASTGMPAVIASTSTPAAAASTRAVIAPALLAIGVGCGVAGLFPGYLGGASLAEQPADLVPHAIYLAAWSASAVLILLGGARLRVGALLGVGTSVVTFGLFFADAGTVIADGTRLIGAGLVLGLVGWLACAAGSTMALRFRLPGLPGGLSRPHGYKKGAVLALTLAALGAAAAFAPSWDSFTLRTSAGVTQSLTQGNAFSNPAPVIAGEVAVMVAIVAVVVAAALWHPFRQGAALLAGAVIPLVAQAISAVVQLGEATSPLQFGILPAQAAQVGLKISSGATLAFWLYCAFVVALVVITGARLLIAPRSVRPAAARQATSAFS